ncbi:MAG: zinc-dependent alcohol dehydrogenase [Jatrophihabitans sp.]
MRALRASPGAALTWHDLPAPPPPGPLGATVRPIAIATCDLDRAVILGRTPFLLPLHLGHECVADITAVGSAVTSVRVGQRVIVPFQISCGSCARCRLGLTSNCMAVPPISMYGLGLAAGHWGGAYADEMSVPFADGMLVPLPPGVDPAAVASVSDNVSDAFRHIGPHLPSLLERDADARVLIIGSLTTRVPFSGSVALYTGQAALALGGRHVQLVDARPAVREHAQQLGIEAVAPRALRRLPPAHLVADVSFSPRGLTTALTKAAPDGIISSSGMLHTRASIPTALMYGRNITLHFGRSNARTHIPQVLHQVAAGQLEPGRVTTITGCLDDAPAVLREHALSGATKTVLTRT